MQTIKVVSDEKKLIDKLIEECTENVEEVKLAKITSTKNKNKYKCSSCILYIVLFRIISTINIGIAAYFVFCKYMNRDIQKLLQGITMSIKQQTININGKYQTNLH